MTGPIPILGIWVHSHEEDTATVSIYRPCDFPFPRSWGRCGLEFGEDGTVVEYRPGADDRARVTTGSWRDLGDGRYSMSFPAEDAAEPITRTRQRVGDALLVDTG
ncbi:hypothetical protein [Nocardia beijingensis]|uniref:Uncharacterized protein n=1 Tax=Nocardia beijingensis TaxID=95162 RepID=A0ABW7W8U9_9NOCA